MVEFDNIGNRILTMYRRNEIDMKRLAYFDNAKFILIFFVVFGHLIQPFASESHSMYTLYTWIYFFHMPAFIFLAGFFAKGSEDFDFISKLARKLLVPYLIFQFMYTIYFFFIGKSDWLTDSVFYPHWSLWFLFSLFSWHMLLILFKKFPKYLGITIAIGIGVVVGFSDSIGHTFSLSRTFVFFPFFLIGYHVTKEQVLFLKNRMVKWILLSVLALLAVAVYVSPELNIGWLLASKSYGTLGVENMGGLVRLLTYGISIVASAAVLAWVPKKETQFSKLGQRTLYVYLLHGFFVQFLRQYDILQVNHFYDVLLIGVLAMMIVISLSSKFSLVVTQPLVEASASQWKKRFKNFKTEKIVRN